MFLKEQVIDILGWLAVGKPYLPCVDCFLPIPCHGTWALFMICKRIDNLSVLFCNGLIWQRLASNLLGCWVCPWMPDCPAASSPVLELPTSATRPHTLFYFEFVKVKENRFVVFENFSVMKRLGIFVFDFVFLQIPIQERCSLPHFTVKIWYLKMSHASSELCHMHVEQALAGGAGSAGTRFRQAAPSVIMGASWILWKISSAGNPERMLWWQFQSFFLCSL